MLSKQKERRPIQDLLEEQMVPQDLFDELEQEFDMFRVVKDHGKSMQTAVNYAFLEHILRASTTEEEESEWLAWVIQEPVKIAISGFLQHKRQASAQEALRKLEETKFEMTMDLSEFWFVTQYNVHGRHYDSEHSSPDSIGSWPVISFVVTHTYAMILYTQSMTFLDGYDPWTGKMKMPLIPEIMIKGVRETLSRYQFQEPLCIKHEIAEETRFSVPVQAINGNETPDSYSDTVSSEPAEERPRSGRNKPHSLGGMLDTPSRSELSDPQVFIVDHYSEPPVEEVDDSMDYVFIDNQKWKEYDRLIKSEGQRKRGGCIDSFCRLF